jgi:hypothetical protein
MHHTLKLSIVHITKRKFFLLPEKSMYLKNILPVILKRLKAIYIQYSNLHPGIDILPNRFIDLINKPGKITKI